jgi:hypothetical protein
MMMMMIITIMISIIIVNDDTNNNLNNDNNLNNNSNNNVHNDEAGTVAGTSGSLSFRIDCMLYILVLETRGACVMAEIPATCCYLIRCLLYLCSCSTPSPRYVVILE